MTVFYPQTIEAISQALTQAAATQQMVSIHNGHTPETSLAQSELRLNLSQLNQLIEYEPANLTVTAQAGMTLADLQTKLRAQGQFLPLDAPQPAHATLGGILASNTHGVWRFRYGTARDWLIGLRAVLADGAVIRGGGRVVKNVAGYDMPKLFIGSLGTLGVIAEATFKLAPLPAMRRTLVAQFATHSAAAQLLPPLLRFAPAPDAVEVLDATVAQIAKLNIAPNHYALIVQLSGDEATVMRLARDVSQIVQKHQGELLGRDSDELWQHLSDLTVTLGEDDATLIEMRLSPSQMGEAWTTIQQQAKKHALNATVFVRAGQSLWAALKGGETTVEGLVNQLRAWTTERKGFLIVQKTAASLKGQIERWGMPRSEVALMRKLKAQFDPQNRLRSEAWAW